ncbi:MAG: pyridoxal 5'-phosphate synthase glutaminase subunit PdxT [Anaerolineaceae bacterium]|nr:pyridoxal 5'-phosphate synthase glutaminase subunit PdxT [Anaerolineaceae bacterium]
MKIGVLALQGAFIEHINMLNRLNVESVEVRLPGHLEGLDALIIPGGESTTIGKLLVDFDLLQPLREFGVKKPIWGTCAGAILLSKDIHRDQPLLELMDLSIERNAFGRQVGSFEVDLDLSNVTGFEDNQRSFRTFFIRAPLIQSVAGDCQALITLPDGRIVAAQQGHLLATSFHPELTDDDRFHRYFLELIK